jgi:membrane associated rhomboid family serine protease
MHLGASGWVFGLWGLSLARAWFERSLGSLLIALLVLFYYGGWWIGLLPSQGISFEYHLFGALCGVLFAALNHRSAERQA